MLDIELLCGRWWTVNCGKYFFHSALASLIIHGVNGMKNVRTEHGKIGYTSAKKEEWNSVIDEKLCYFPTTILAHF